MVRIQLEKSIRRHAGGTGVGKQDACGPVAPYNPFAFPGGRLDGDGGRGPILNVPAGVGCVFAGVCVFAGRGVAVFAGVGETDGAGVGLKRGDGDGDGRVFVFVLSFVFRVALVFEFISKFELALKLKFESNPRFVFRFVF